MNCLCIITRGKKTTYGEMKNQRSTRPLGIRAPGTGQKKSATLLSGVSGDDVFAGRRWSNTPVERLFYLLRQAVSVCVFRCTWHCIARQHSMMRGA